ncbi:MAG: DUF3027 domain-containing protein [Actinomycetales bacterium]|nr:DUF3027 domain-containing protein [Actinomycetales bacterium]
MIDYQSLAREAANESYGKTSVGEFSHTYQEAQDGVISYLFKSKLKGYPDWFISVTLFVSGWEATVSEVQLTPGDTSLVAPKWVPWSERLADYKALQAAMEAEAAAAAALADDSDDADDSDESDDDFENAADDADDEAADTDAEASENAGESDLAVADVPEAPAAEDDADAAGGKSKGLFKWKTLRGKKKHK